MGLDRNFKTKRQEAHLKKTFFFNQDGEKNYKWKGNNVGYKGLHMWIREHKKKPKKCQFCNKETAKLEVANRSGKYKRNLKDWIWLCRSCHLRFDDVANKAWKTKRGGLLRD